MGGVGEGKGEASAGEGQVRTKPKVTWRQDRFGRNTEEDGRHEKE